MFEVRQLMSDGLEYFSSAWNFNDILLMISSIIALVLEGFYQFHLR